MASVLNLLRTCGLIICVIIQVYAVRETVSVPRIDSIEVKEKSCDFNKCKYLLNVRGGEFLGHCSWRLTPEKAFRGSSCDVISPNYELLEIETDRWNSTFQVFIPESEGRTFFCLRHYERKNTPFGGKWVHQGEHLFLDPKNDVISGSRGAELSNTNVTPKTLNLEVNTKWPDLSHDTDINNMPSVNRPARHERADIEVYIKDKYVPLSEITNNQVQKDTDDKLEVKNSNQSKVDQYNQVVFENSLVNDVNDVQNNEDLSETFESWNLKAKLMLKRRKRNLIANHEVIVSNPTKASFNKSLNLSSKVNEAKKLILSPPETVSLIQDTISKKDETTVVETGDSSSYSNTEPPKPKTGRNYRKKRSKNTTDSLLSKEDIIKAKQELQNTVTPPENTEIHEDALIKIRKERQVMSSDFTSVRADPVTVRIEGLRVEDSAKEPKIIEDTIPSVLADTGVTLRLFGEGLTTRTMIAFTYDAMKFGDPCKFLVKGEYLIKPESLTSKTGLFDIVAPPPSTSSKLYICAKNLKPGVTDPFLDEDKYYHQGTEPFKILATHKKLLPLWVTLTLIMICLMFSALFSGLNLGLMSLDRTELKIISNTGTEQERKYARAIMPVRDHGNYLLCSILLGNVAVNSTFTILLDELTSGLFAVIFSTLAIVLLGEITPQAICSRHGLMVGAKSIMITKAVMAITAPLAFPVSKLLDYFLGEEIGSVYNRERLKELVKVTTDVNDLDRDEVNIISGALELRKKTVSDVMTKLEDVFMLPITAVLDFETMSEIVKSGYSRIPVYETHHSNIVTVLFIKDLAFVDPDDNTPLRTLCQYYQNPCNFVFEDVTLDVMFKQFKDGHKGHMAFVHRINNEGEGDPFYETIGLVTLEDVIEEMIQAEIIDETDVFMDNRTKRRRNRPANKLQDFAAFAERHENQRIHISPQLTLATFQFLSTSVEAFRPDTVSETVLRRLLKQDVIQYIKIKGKNKKDPSTYVFYQGKPVDYFVLILEGRVEVTVGRENLVFEAGPFTYFGVQALTQNVGVAESPTPSAMGSLQNINMDAMLRHTFVPDYSVRAITELYYLTVKRSLYLAAKRATLMEKGALSKGATHEQFDTEVDKHLFNSSSANIPMSFMPKKWMGISTSTGSAKDDVGSTSNSYKLSPRLNIIELLQIPPASTASNKSDRLTNSWPDTHSCKEPRMSGRAFNNSWETAKWSSFQDPSRSQCWPQEWSKSLANACKHANRSDLDPYKCSECVQNNFWMSKSVLNKSFDNVKSGDERDHNCKKKRTTFHTDSSLLTFHPLSSPHDFYNPKTDNENHKPFVKTIGGKTICIDVTTNISVNEMDGNSKVNDSEKLSQFTCRIANTAETGVDLNGSPSNLVCTDSNDDTVTSNTCIHRKMDLRGDDEELKTIKEYSNAHASTSYLYVDAQTSTKKDSKSLLESSKSVTLYSKDYTLEKDSYNRAPRLERSSVDQREIEKDVVEYSDWREERLLWERRRLESEERVLSQLSKIIKILEKKDQT